jgi:hypothetical protein
MKTISTVTRNHHRLRTVGMIVLLIALSLAGIGHGPSRLQSEVLRNPSLSHRRVTRSNHSSTSVLPNPAGL